MISHPHKRNQISIDRPNRHYYCIIILSLLILKKLNFSYFLKSLKKIYRMMINYHGDGKLLTKTFFCVEVCHLFDESIQFPWLRSDDLNEEAKWIFDGWNKNFTISKSMKIGCKSRFLWDWIFFVAVVFFIVIRDSC